MNYYERHIGDYLKDTSHLSLLEHGVYSRLMDVYYTKETGLPADDIERLIGARNKDEKAALKTVLKEFFVLNADAYTQARCDREIARFKDKQEKAKRSANARWNSQQQHTEGNANASPNAMRTHTEGNALQSPVTSNHTPVKNTERTAARGSRLPPDFDLDFQFAVDQGIQNTLEEAHKFRDYWHSQPGQKGVKLDWQATWRNWCRNAKTTPVKTTGETAYQRSMRQRVAEFAPRIARVAPGEEFSNQGGGHVAIAAGR